MLLPVEVVLLLSTLSHLLGEVSASLGDRSWIFQKCMGACLYKKCTDMNRFVARQPRHRALLRWSCEDECKYTCMWKTVEAFRRDGSRVPQFYGKWPFVRWWGIQEPASVLFSILNFLCHFLIFKFRSKVPSSAPMYYVWHGACLVGFNAWFWSIVFHTRDTDFTEHEGYIANCLSRDVIETSIFEFLETYGPTVDNEPVNEFLGMERLWRPVLVGMCVLTGYALHVYYLGWVKFDYSYNMAANVGVGCVVLGGWLLWCVRVRRHHPYVWKCVVFLVCMNLLLLLELGDFPPIYWVFDAHSLWHAGTSPLGILWYSFITDDCLSLLKQQEDKADKLDEANGTKKAV